MYKINSNLSVSEFNLVKSIIDKTNLNTVGLRNRTKIITKYLFKNPMRYIEENYPNNNEVKCAFCNSIKKFISYDIILKDNEFYITNIIYKNNLLICNRPHEELKSNGIYCERNTYNTNSFIYVQKVYNVSIEEAKIILKERNKSPFYKENFNSEEEYSNSQREKANKQTEESFEMAKFKRSLLYFCVKFGAVEGEREIY